MNKTIMQKILILLSLFSLLACGGSSGGSQNAGHAAGPPELTSLNPAPNDSSVLLASSITAMFDKSMNSGSPSTFVVYGSQTGKLLGGTYTGGGSDTLSFAAGSSFKVGEEIEVILTDMLTSTGGVSLESPFVYRFRAETLGGTGNFTVGDTVSGQTDIRALVAGDWDGDGDLDLAAANFSDSLVAVLRNDGSGHFTLAPTDIVLGQIDVQALVAGDWDGDGDLDLAAANNGTSTVAILINDGSGIFAVADTVLGQADVVALVAGDWDGDGDLDLAANSGISTVNVLENDGTGDFTPADTVSGQTNVQALIAGDWDGDGDLDLASANFGSSVVGILINDGFGDFTAGNPIGGQPSVVALAAGDWNGDGDLDLAANSGISTINVLKNDGSGSFTLLDSISGQTNVKALVAGDWDGDGDLDLAAANSSASEVAILINGGMASGNFTVADTVLNQTGVQALAAGDWDGDNDLDLAGANDGNSTINTLEND